MNGTTWPTDSVITSIFVEQAGGTDTKTWTDIYS